MFCHLASQYDIRGGCIAFCDLALNNQYVLYQTSYVSPGRAVSMEPASVLLRELSNFQNR